MLLTEKEAKEKWCPHSRQNWGDATYNRQDNGDAAPSCLCIASGCMAWRWEWTEDGGFASLSGARGKRGEVPSDALGFCGDFGHPVTR